MYTCLGRPQKKFLFNGRAVQELGGRGVMAVSLRKKEIFHSPFKLARGGGLKGL